MKETNRPSHFVYAVRKGTGDQSFWTRIGAAWANRDGDGFNVRLELLPIAGSDIVIRKPKPEQGEQADA